MKELFLFVRPPRPLWPFNGPASAFWPPLAFASLAAVLREPAADDLRVEILDAPSLEMGWRALQAEIQRASAGLRGIGEEAVGCGESLRLAGSPRTSARGHRRAAASSATLRRKCSQRACRRRRPRRRRRNHRGACRRPCGQADATACSACRG